MITEACFQDTAELFFEDCRLPADALLGGEAGLNRGFYQLMQELPQERLLISNLCMAACEFMFEETRDYVKQRKAFGKTLSKLQTIQHKLAEMKTEVSAMKLVMLGFCWFIFRSATENSL